MLLVNCEHELYYTLKQVSPLSVIYSTRQLTLTDISFILCSVHLSITNVFLRAYNKQYSDNKIIINFI